MQTHVLTVGTDQSKMFMLEQSSERHGINFLNLGHGVEWRGGSMSETGGGQKNKPCSQPCAIFTR